MCALVLVGLLVSGCGQEPRRHEVVAQAGERTHQAESARVAMTVGQDAGGLSMTVSSEGVIDFASGRARLRTQVPGLPAGAGDAITTIVDGTVVYTQVPLPGASPRWMRVDAVEMAGLSSESLGPGQNPADSLDYLRGMTDDVTEEGRADVRGVATTHYQGTVNLERAAQLLPEEQRDLVRQTAQLLGSPELPVSAWVDDDGLVRRMRYTLALTLFAQGDGQQPVPFDGTATFEQEFFDFGIEVDIALPPEEEITDFDPDELDFQRPTGGPTA